MLLGVSWLRAAVGVWWSAIALGRLKTPSSLTWWLDSAPDRYRQTTRCCGVFLLTCLLWASFSACRPLNLETCPSDQDWRPLQVRAFGKVQPADEVRIFWCFSSFPCKTTIKACLVSFHSKCTGQSFFIAGRDAVNSDKMNKFHNWPSSCTLQTLKKK